METILLQAFVLPNNTIENEKKAIILEKFNAFKNWSKNEINLM